MIDLKSEKYQVLLNHELLFILIIILFGGFFYFWVLTRNPLIYGIDGPYYLIQVRSILENGNLVYGDPPLSFYIFTIFTLLFGGDITLGVRVGVVLFSALSALPIYFLVKKVTGLEIAGYTAMIVNFFFSPHIRMINDLLKNAVGACFLLFFVYYVHNIVFTEDRLKNMIFSSMFLILTGLTHILDLGVAILFLTLYLLGAVVLNINRRDVLKYLGLLVLILGFLSVLTIIVFPSLFSDFNKGIAFLQDLFTATGETNPILFVFDPRGGGLIIPVLCIGVFLVYSEWKTRNTEANLFLMVSTLIGVILSLPFIPQQWLWRFLLMEFIPASFILGYCISKIGSKKLISIFVILAIFPIIFQGFEAARRLGPVINEKGYSELEHISGLIPSDSVVISEPSIMYWVEYVIGSDISKRPSPDLWESYSNVFGLFRINPKFPPLPHGTVVYEGKVLRLMKL